MASEPSCGPMTKVTSPNHILAAAAVVVVERRIAGPTVLLGLTELVAALDGALDPAELPPFPLAVPPAPFFCTVA